MSDHARSHLWWDLDLELHDRSVWLLLGQMMHVIRVRAWRLHRALRRLVPHVARLRKWGLEDLVRLRLD